MEWIFSPLDGTFSRDEFDCGVPQLNDYLKKYARQNQEKGIAKTFVAITDVENKIIVGYYSVSMGQVEFESMPQQYRRGLPRYPLPAMRVGKLAVDSSMQGRGLGKELLMDCFRKAFSLSQDIGIFAVTVDAINEQAKAFYLKYGFIQLQDHPFSLFIPITTISSSIEYI